MKIVTNKKEFIDWIDDGVFETGNAKYVRLLRFKKEKMLHLWENTDLVANYCEENRRVIV